MRLLTSFLSVSDGGYTGPPVIPDLGTPVEKLDSSVDMTSDSAMWFYPYKASEFPEITGVTKKYFFIWSTDHATKGTYWGEGDDLELSDFIEKGRCFTTNDSTETPILYRIGSILFLSVHPSNIPQQTDVWSTSGGSLTSINTNGSWTKHDNALGLYTLANGNQINGEDETHTGYMIWNTIQNTLDGTTYQYEGQHLGGGTNFDNSFSRYSYTNDGINWVREDRYNIDKRLQPEYLNEMRGHYIVRRGVIYAFQRFTRDSRIDPSNYDTKLIGFCKFDSNYRNPEFIKYLTDFECSDFSAYIDSEDSNTVHIYITNPRFSTPTKVYHATMDISKL
jgi:hypothetical protein